MNPNPAPAASFNLDASNKALGGALVSYITISFRQPGDPIDENAGREFFENVGEALSAGVQACAEIKRIRDDLAAIRDRHRPRPHADPNAPGALCEACSLHGALIQWPCATWQAIDRTLTHGQR